MRRLLPVLFLLLAGSLSAATFNVNSTTDADDASLGNGICADANGNCTLRAAVREASALAASGPHTVVVPAGTYTITIPRVPLDLSGANGRLKTSGVVHIQGAGAATTIVDGGALDRVFQLDSGTISGLTIRNGRVFQFEVSSPSGGQGVQGGGVDVGGTVTMQNCIVTNNVVDAPSTPSGFASANGGGITVGGTLTLVDSVVENNLAVAASGSVVNHGRGGGIYVGVGRLTLTRSTVRSNVARATSAASSVATARGGGIYLFNHSISEITASQSTISDNTAELTSASHNDSKVTGGGIHAEGGTLTITNSTISGNEAETTANPNVVSTGGGYYRESGSNIHSFTHVTIAANQAARGGGVVASNDASRLRHTIVADNTATTSPDCDGTLVTDGFNLVENNSGCTLTVAIGGDLLGVDPNLGPLQNNGGTTNTHALLAPSPAIDYVPVGAASIPSVDQRNAPRPVDGDSDGNPRADIGAFEFCAAPQITGDSVADGGATVVLTATGGGTGYSWYRNGVVIPGQNGSTLTLNSVAPATHSGSYVVIADYGCGAQQSVPFVFSVRYTITNRELFWHHAQTGGVYLWRLDASGTSVSDVRPLAVVPDLGWQIVGSGDLNADGNRDLVWQHEGTGQPYIWFTDGLNVTSAVPLPLPPDNLWIIRAVADFDADSRPDLFWSRTDGGSTLNYVWLMDGGTVREAKPLPTTAASLELLGAADFDGDSTADLLWRNPATTVLTVWRIRAGVHVSSSSPGSLANGDVVQAIGDLDADGDADLVYRDTFGSHWAWLLGNGSPQILPPAGNYVIRAAGDFNADGMLDLIWRNDANGGNYVWLMNGTTVTTSTALPQVPDADWRIVAPKPKSRS